MVDTIFALSSGALPCAIAVVRISGPSSGAALEALAGKLPPPRRVALRHLRSSDGEILDQALVMWMPGPSTEVGEDMAELHLHGSRAVVAAVSATLAGQPGVRPARAGEFTRRAFANGKLDLAQVEGLGDLIAAETDGQRRNALAIAGGGLSRRIEGWRRRILDLAVAVEAILDHEDESDVPSAFCGDDLPLLTEEIAGALAVPPAERLRDGVRVAIAGPPNAGKSTLFNALIGRDAAIVSDVPGTTRDVIEAPVSFDGIAFVISDTAGLRESEDAIEREGVGRAERVIASADVLLWLGEEPVPPGAIHVFARADSRDATIKGSATLPVSAKTGAGIPLLVETLVSHARALLPHEGEIALGCRQREQLADCLAALQAIDPCGDLLLVAEELRIARAALDAMRGVSGVEELLDSLFGNFCIGK